MEVLHIKENNTSHENANILCDPCEGNSETKTAETYCIDCNEFLCNNCAKVHRKSRMSRHHKVLEGDEMPRQKLVLSDDDVCSRHDGKPLEYFCNNHAGFYCTSCVTLDHRNCKLEYLTEKAEGFEDSEGYKTLVNRIQRVSQLITGANDKIGLCKGEAKSNHLKFLKEIREFRNNIETILQATEDKAKEEANLTRTRDQNVFDSLSQRSNKMHREVDAILEGMDRLKACRQQSRLCIAAKQVETKIKTFETELEKINAKAKVSRYSFQGSDIMKQNIGSWAGQKLLKFADDSASSDKLPNDELDKGSDFEEKKESGASQSPFVCFQFMPQAIPSTTSSRNSRSGYGQYSPFLDTVRPIDYPTKLNVESGKKQQSSNTYLTSKTTTPAKYSDQQIGQKSLVNIDVEPQLLDSYKTVTQPDGICYNQALRQSVINSQKHTLGGNQMFMHPAQNQTNRKPDIRFFP